MEKADLLGATVMEDVEPRYFGKIVTDFPATDEAQRETKIIFYGLQHSIMDTPEHLRAWIKTVKMKVATINRYYTKLSDLHVVTSEDHISGTIDLHVPGLIKMEFYKEQE